MWVIVSLAMAAAVTPVLHEAGKALASSAAAEKLPAFFEWLGAASGRAKLGRYFSRSLLLSALVLLPFLFWRLRAISAGGAAPLAKLPAGVALVQVVTGFAIAGGLLWGMGWVIQHLGAYVPDPTPPPFGKVLKKALPATLVAPLLEEWLFRGLLLGLWLKHSKPLVAMLGTSLVFGFIHFLEPPEGMVIADPGSPWAGFELLGKIVFHFADPRFFVTDFATLFGIGMILAWARLRTGALWFSIGLHAGWILAFKTYNLLYRDVDGHPLHPWGVGDSLRSGLIPMATLLLTAVICHFVLPRKTAAA